jgi:iron complex outermembrane receptor protein
MTSPTRLLLAGLLLTAAVPAHAQTQPSDLALATIEDLMNIEMTSAARKEQRVDVVPAAVYVITQDDIRRSGMTSIPDLLRLVPGVQVAQINANKWAISVRGFNSLYSTKLLVLIDGRSIYNPLFATVLWDTEDLLLEDVDRIEMIRGPGAAVWGANAVNGVINILTKGSADTQGLFARAGQGAPNATDLAIRFGGQAAGGAYRVYSQASSHAGTQLPGGAPADDAWRTLTAGFRGDWASGPNAFLLQGNATAGQQRPLWFNLDAATAVTGAPAPHPVSDTQVANVLGRWERTRANGAVFQLQSFADFAHRREAIGEYHRRTIDLDAEYHAQAGARHDLVAGGGYRAIDEEMAGDGGYNFTPDHARTTLVNAFAQDEIALANDRVHVTLGTKFEHETFAGSGFQPTARVLWTLAPQQHLWAAVSRALRTPSLIDRGLSVQFPPVPQADGLPIVYGAHGNPAVTSERLLSVEGGYRVGVAAVASIDVTGFVGRYDGLMTYEPLPPSLAVSARLQVVRADTQFQNALRARTSGAELAGRVKLTSAWQVDGGLSVFHLTPDASGSLRPDAAEYDGHAPRYQWRAHSAFSLGRRAQADLQLFHVGPIEQLGTPGYFRADARLEWKLSARLTAIAAGQNLLAPAHREFDGDDTNILATLAPRSAGLRLTWHF